MSEERGLSLGLPAAEDLERRVVAAFSALGEAFRQAAEHMDQAAAALAQELDRQGVTPSDVESVVAELESARRQRRKPGPRRKDLGAKTCPVCQEQFVRRPTETTSAFRKRSTCGKPSCRSAWTSARLAGVERGAKSLPGPQLRTCVVCGEQFERRPGERLGDFNRRASCLRPECLKAMAREGGRKGGEAKRRAAAAAASSPATPSRPRPPAPPPPAPRPPRVPEPPIPTPPAIEAEERWQPPRRGPVVEVPAGATLEVAERPKSAPEGFGGPCPVHPTYTIGLHGCTACNAGEKWKRGQGVAYISEGSRP